MKPRRQDVQKSPKKSKPILKKVGTVVTILVFTAILVCIVSVVTTKYIYHKPAALFGYRIVKILTDSMAPQIPANSYILVKNIEGKEAKEGDIVVYTPASGPFAGLTMTHKCIRGPYEDNGTTYILTQGTKEGAPVDDPVPIANVQSVYIRSFGKAGGFFDFLTSKWGVIVLVALPSLVVVILQIIRMIKAVAAKPDEEKVRLEAERIEAENQRKQQEAMARMLSEGGANAQSTIPNQDALGDVLAFIAREKAKGVVTDDESSSSQAQSTTAVGQSTPKKDADTPTSVTQVQGGLDSKVSAEINSVLAFIAKQKANADKKEEE